MSERSEWVPWDPKKISIMIFSHSEFQMLLYILEEHGYMKGNQSVLDIIGNAQDIDFSSEGILLEISLRMKMLCSVSLIFDIAVYAYTFEEACALIEGNSIQKYELPERI